MINIKVHGNRDYEIVQELKETRRPILIYGCANYAELVYRYLIRHKLEIESFLVDARYWRENWFICDKKVENIEKYKNNLEEYNIVIGFCNVEKSRVFLENPLLLKGRFYFLWEPLEIYKWDASYLKACRDGFKEVFDNLADELSKKVLEELITAKLNFDGRKLINLADSRQYFNELTYLHNPQNEIYVDCGAYNGDTILRYADFTNGLYKKIYAIEPDKQNVRMLIKNTEHLSRLEIVAKGTWKEKTSLKFMEDGSASRVTKNSKNPDVEVVTIDEVVKSDKVTFIKMDVEGSEVESLKGAKNTIRQNMPKLAICCYHKKDDIINFYYYLKAFNNNNTKYVFYLRHHSNSVYETVFYAIPVKKA